MRHDDDVVAPMHIGEAVDGGEASCPEFGSRLPERHKVPAAFKPEPTLPLDPLGFWY